MKIKRVIRTEMQKKECYGKMVRLRPNSPTVPIKFVSKCKVIYLCFVDRSNGTPSEADKVCARSIDSEGLANRLSISSKSLLTE